MQKHRTIKNKNKGKNKKRTKRGGGLFGNNSQSQQNSGLYNPQLLTNPNDISNSVTEYNNKCSGWYKTKSQDCKNLSNNIIVGASNVNDLGTLQSIYNTSCPKNSLGQENTSSVCKAIRNQALNIKQRNWNSQPDTYTSDNYTWGNNDSYCDDNNIPPSTFSNDINAVNTDLNRCCSNPNTQMPEWCDSLQNQKMRIMNKQARGNSYALDGLEGETYGTPRSSYTNPRSRNSSYGYTTAQNSPMNDDGYDYETLGGKRIRRKGRKTKKRK